MKIKNIIVGLMLAISTISCNDWFDVSPSSDIKDSDLFKNEQGFKDLLTGVYQLSGHNTLYGKELTYGYNDVRAQYWSTGTVSEHNYYYAKQYDYTEMGEEARINSIWNNSYYAIVNLNILLNNIDAKKDVFTGNNYELIKGEALALRAFYHFDLLRQFAPSPAFGTEAKAIPYYKTETVSPQPQLTISEVIGNIREDIEGARGIMKDVDYYGPTSLDGDSTRNMKMNYWAATGLLARVEMYAGNKSAALSAAKEVIGEPDSELKEPLMLSTQESSDKIMAKELLFGLYVSKIEEFTENIFPSSGGTEQSIDYLYVSVADYNLLYTTGDAADVEFRKSMWFVAPNDQQYTLSKYNDLSDELIPMIKLSELYYIAAECETDSNKALEYLNRIRSARGLTSLDSSVDLEDAIEAEYKKEFVGEGQLFYYFKRKAQGLIGIGNTTSISTDSYTLPIPTNELEFGIIE